MSQQTNWVPTSVDLEKPSAARAYDYVLGGNHNFTVDREFVRLVHERHPDSKHFALQNRAFLRRVVLFLIEQGVRQFLDLGSGIPTVGNVHEIAQAADPSARVVYVDIEHVAVAHSQLLLEDNEHAAMVHADITRPGLVLNDPDTRRVLDFDQPVGILGITIGHYILDNPEGVFAAYRDAVPAGSYLALSHLTDDFIELSDFTEAIGHSQTAVLPRSKAEIARLFGDWELVEPGLVMTSQWRPDREEDTRETSEQRDGLYAGVARKR
ncbi:S-adenosyl methyltransferase [Actinophytocola oryzae]|uniref:S-adenosyl methyltransferase n=1 Tax=Actinophytocola oryzae TaxID=502181 RepID=A0A4R7VRJ2_9PSEU|nr:S-adenosyl methyltransferase [Actinophytocola oryzae]